MSRFVRDELTSICQLKRKIINDLIEKKTLGAITSRDSRNERSCRKLEDDLEIFMRSQRESKRKMKEIANFKMFESRLSTERKEKKEPVLIRNINFKNEVKRRKTSIKNALYESPVKIKLKQAPLTERTKKETKCKVLENQKCLRKNRNSSVGSYSSRLYEMPLFSVFKMV